MKTKIVMIATLAVSLATLAATVAFGVISWKNRWVADEWDIYDEKAGFYDDEE